MAVLSSGVYVRKCVLVGVKLQKRTVIGKRISGQVDLAQSHLVVMQWISMILAGVQTVNSL